MAIRLKKMRFIFLFILIGILFNFVFLSSNVLGLGVSPGAIEIEFKPNLSTSFEMGVYNYPAKDQDVKIYVSATELDEDVVDEFSNIISLEKTQLSFTKEENVKTLKVYINFPQGISKPGVHELRIGAMPYSKEDREGISIIAGNEIRVFINVSAEYASEKFARIKILKILNVIADEVKVGGKSNISISVKSESDVSLNNIYGKVKVLKGDKELATLETNKISIEPQETKTLRTLFDTGMLQPSVLTLNAEVFYNSKSVKAQGILKILEEEEVLREKGFHWWWILIILLLLIIILLLFFLLRKREKEKQETQPTTQQV